MRDVRVTDARKAFFAETVPEIFSEILFVVLLVLGLFLLLSVTARRRARAAVAAQSAPPRLDPTFPQIDAVPAPAPALAADEELASRV